mgnify:CR=1 FL=1
MKYKEKKKKTITGRKSKIVCERLPQTITIADDGNTGDYLYDYLLLYANLWIAIAFKSYTVIDTIDSAKWVGWANFKILEQAEVNNCDVLSL